MSLARGHTQAAEEVADSVLSGLNRGHGRLGTGAVKGDFVPVTRVASASSPRICEPGLGPLLCARSSPQVPLAGFALQEVVGEILAAVLTIQVSDLRPSALVRSSTVSGLPQPGDRGEGFMAEPDRCCAFVYSRQFHYRQSPSWTGR